MLYVLTKWEHGYSRENAVQKGSVVEEVKLDEETGLYPTGYDAVSEALYNESVNIFNRIQDSKTE